MKLAVIGHPIKHSKSPIIHNHWLAQNNIKGSYEAIDINPDNFENEIMGMMNDGFDGFNITIPFKTNIIDLCDDVDDAAQKIGAVNTVHIKNKKLYGYNTDAYGFIENIKSSKPAFDFKNKTAMVLGAGGAANAILYGLIQSGVKKIYLTNRTQSKAAVLQSMAHDIIDVIAWDAYEEKFNETDILINTTALGMVGHPDLTPTLDGLKQGALVTDIVYNPLYTSLLQNAKEKQYQYVTGIGMLAYQAQKAFEIWTGTLPVIDNALMEQL